MPVVVAKSSTVPLACVNTPVFVKDLPTESLPAGSTTVPVATLNVIVVVALVSRNVHPPPIPLNVRL